LASGCSTNGKRGRLVIPPRLIDIASRLSVSTREGLLPHHAALETHLPRLVISVAIWWQMVPFRRVLGNSAGRKSFKINARLLPYFHGMEVPNSVAQRFPKARHRSTRHNRSSRLRELQFNLLRRPVQIHDSKTANLPGPHGLCLELKAERSAFDSCGASIFILAGVAAVILQEA